MMFLALGACKIAVAACIPRAWLELLIGDPSQFKDTP